MDAGSSTQCGILTDAVRIEKRVPFSDERAGFGIAIL